MTCVDSRSSLLCAARSALLCCSSVDSDSKSTRLVTVVVVQSWAPTSLHVAKVSKGNAGRESMAGRRGAAHSLVLHVCCSLSVSRRCARPIWSSRPSSCWTQTMRRTKCGRWGQAHSNSARSASDESRTVLDSARLLGLRSGAQPELTPAAHNGLAPGSPDLTAFCALCLCVQHHRHSRADLLQRWKTSDHPSHRLRGQRRVRRIRQQGGNHGAVSDSEGHGERWRPRAQRGLLSGDRDHLTPVSPAADIHPRSPDCFTQLPSRCCYTLDCSPCRALEPHLAIAIV